MTPKEHEKWFRETVLSRKALCFVGFEGTFPESSEIGYCRFDRKAAGFFEVSIVISPEKQGRGLAGLLLAEACIRLRQVVATPITIEAKIQKGNLRSLRLFESAGFTGFRNDDDAIWVLEKQLN